MDVTILYEDEDVAVLNKPAGISVHNDGKSDLPVLTDWIQKQFPEVYEGEPHKLQSGRSVARPGIVHRLDKETSGALLIAKSKEGYDMLKEQFMDREIKKTYTAILDGVLKEERGVIQKSIGRSSTDARKRVAKKSAEILSGEREAMTVYKVIKRTATNTLVEAWPKTGRTHQLRVHFKSLHHPIIGDSLYGKRQNKLGLKRLGLHARSLVFKNFMGKEISVTAPYPEDFKEALDKLGK